ncbi:MAG: pathogenicity locus [Candidatus Latescibacterota bacterium]|nr:MAG: pathogenicity locus [Candidatus Latescibacterota bacterium]
MGKSKTPLESLPGIGPNLAKDLIDLGFNNPSDLRGQDPEAMFSELCDLRGQKIDRCVLYAFRCAVYCSGTEAPDPELMKWWNWMDRMQSGA